MRTCPYCGQQAMSVFRKLNLGPTRGVKCQSCDKRVSVSWLSLFGMAALYVSIAAAAYVGLPLGVPAVVMGAIAMLLIHYAAPLVGRRDEFSEVLRRPAQ
jgi:hypothetical protein